MGKEPDCQWQETEETWVQSLGWEDPLEEGMATQSMLNRTIPLQQTHKVGGEADGGKRSTRCLTLVVDGSFTTELLCLQE